MVKSWTIHDKQFGSNVTIRFVESIPATRENPASPQSHKYKQKSEYQVKRDRDRMAHYNTHSEAEGIRSSDVTQVSAANLSLATS